MKHQLVKKLEERLLPEFEEIAEKIRLEIPNISVGVYSSSVGSETQYQGHGFYIDCTILDALDENPDNIGLDVGLGYLTTIPRVSGGVCWGHPSGSSEANFKDWGGIFPNEGMIFTDELFEELCQDLPRFYEALFEALRRRKPKDLC